MDAGHNRLPNLVVSFRMIVDWSYIVQQYSRIHTEGKVILSILAGFTFLAVIISVTFLYRRALAIRNRVATMENSNEDSETSPLLGVWDETPADDGPGPSPDYGAFFDFSSPRFQDQSQSDPDSSPQEDIASDPSTDPIFAMDIDPRLEIAPVPIEQMAKLSLRETPPSTAANKNGFLYGWENETTRKQSIGNAIERYDLVFAGFPLPTLDITEQYDSEMSIDSDEDKMVD
ncbi:hypothetical protein ABW21_db0207767 [Orbilia brochopaga]|nr:hypothetical protein ABW21_db0207767 [Drechslerella brochopaga]